MSTNSLTIEYRHPQSDKWTITQCTLIQSWPKRRVIKSELPKALAFDLAEALIRVEQFKVMLDEWLPDGTRIVRLIQDRETILAQQQAELLERQRSERVILEQEHVRKLEAARQIKLDQEPVISLCGLRPPACYGDSVRTSKAYRIETQIDDLLNYREDKEWARRMYANAA